MADKVRAINDKRRVDKYNETAHELPPLKVGSRVRVQDVRNKRWELEATIVSVLPFRRYLIKTPGGRVLARNRVHLRPIPTRAIIATKPASTDISPVSASSSSRGSTPTPLSSPVRSTTVSMSPLPSLPSRGNTPVPLSTASPIRAARSLPSPNPSPPVVPSPPALRTRSRMPRVPQTLPPPSSSRPVRKKQAPGWTKLYDMSYWTGTGAYSSESD